MMATSIRHDLVRRTQQMQGQVPGDLHMQGNEQPDEVRPLNRGYNRKQLNGILLSSPIELKVGKKFSLLKERQRE